MTKPTAAMSVKQDGPGCRGTTKVRLQQEA
jgi:hypothetical protein